MSKLWLQYQNWSKLEQSSSCTSRTLSCTGGTWPKMTSNEIVPVQTQIVPVQVSEKCPESVISPLFHALFHPKPNLYFIYTSKSFQIHLISSIILNHLSIHIFLQDISWFSPKTILIWVITHTNTKYTNLLGFVLTQPFYFAIKP